MRRYRHLPEHHLRIDRPDRRVLAHHDFIAGTRQHRRRRHGILRDDGPDVFVFRAQVLNDLIRRLQRSAGTVQDQIELRSFKLVKARHKALDVILRDR